MKKVKASEFGELIGQSRQYINVNKKRERIFADEKGLFDLGNPVNKAWYDSKRAEYIAKNASSTNISMQPTPKAIEKSKDTIAKNESNELKDDSPPEQLTFALQKQQADLELKLLTLKEKEIELNRKQGKLLNVDTASKITMAYMSMFKKSLHRDLETLIHRICDVYKIDLEKKAGYVNELIGIMNNSSDRTMEELNNSLQTEDVEL